jgi:hypothetical protein
MREGEIAGVNYHYVSLEEFQAMINKDEFMEHQTFNGWNYGTTWRSWQESEVFIMTPSGIQDVKRHLSGSVVIYLDIPLEIRRERMKKRSDADRVERRIEADRKDFKNIEEMLEQIVLAKRNESDDCNERGGGDVIHGGKDDGCSEIQWYAACKVGCDCCVITIRDPLFDANEVKLHCMTLLRKDII